MNKRVITYIYGIGVVLIIWKCLNVFYDSRLIPAPLETFNYLFNNLSEIIFHSLRSLYRIIMALVFVIIIGVSLGIFIGTNKAADNLISPIVYVFYPVPKIAFLSVIMIFFGLKDFSKIFLIFFILVFQVVLSVRDSVKNIDDEVYHSVYHLSLSKASILRHVVLPSIMPNLFTSIRIGVATGFSVLFLAENYATQQGIGYYIMDSWIMSNYTRMFSGIVTISVLGSLFFFAVDLLERVLCKYKFINNQK